ncbi:MAG: hypothetical protein KatS3mg131_1596 [Candidatus Tectimicrobiota bacterium]|nr:MAG: hypothetical protein KatS3mg131_1596 [Candidatus Tectomicrobia bacterium]
MRLKLDENFDLRLVPALRKEGFEVDTVRDEGLSGSSDQVVYQVCRDSRRVLVSLGLDFSNPLRYPPEPTEGIVIVRVPRALLSLIRTTSALAEMKSGPLKGALWIVEPGRIRIHEPRRERSQEESE